MNKLRLMLIDDHSVMRAGIKSLLEQQSDMVVVAEASSTHDAVRQIQETRPDILLLDLTLPDGGSLELIRTLRPLTDSPRVLVLTMHDDPAYTRSAISSGAVGYVVKTVGEQELLNAIRAVGRGQVVIDLDDSAKSSAIYNDVTAHGRPHAGLSEREREVLVLLGKGFTNQEVAAKLDVSPKTVATYKARIGEKVGLRSTAEFVKYVADNGLS